MYAWAFDLDDYFTGEFETLEEAIADARKEAARCEDRKIIMAYVGKIKYYSPGPDVFDVLETISDDCYDETCCDCYLTDVPENEEEELQAALQKTFLEWAKKHGYNPEKIWSVPYSTVRKVML